MITSKSALASPAGKHCILYPLNTTSTFNSSTFRSTQTWGNCHSVRVLWSPYSQFQHSTLSPEPWWSTAGHWAGCPGELGGSQKSAAAGEVHSYLLATYHLVPSLQLGRGRGRREEEKGGGEEGGGGRGRGGEGSGEGRGNKIHCTHAQVYICWTTWTTQHKTLTTPVQCCRTPLPRTSIPPVHNMSAHTRISH